MQKCYLCHKKLRTYTYPLSRLLFWLDDATVVTYLQEIGDVTAVIRIHLCKEDVDIYQRTPEVTQELVLQKLKKLYKEQYGEDLP